MPEQELDPIQVIKDMLEGDKRSKTIYQDHLKEVDELNRKYSLKKSTDNSEVVLTKATRDELMEKFDKGTISQDEFKTLKTYLNTKVKKINTKSSEPNN